VQGKAMNRRSTAALVRSIRSAADTRPDAELLAAFAATGDSAAFEAIVRRHGPLVRSACRQVLRDPADVDDAFQATFVALHRRPQSVRQGAALAGWLFRVARRAAQAVRNAAERRRRCEAKVISPAADDGPDLSWREACAILHEEL